MTPHNLELERALLGALLSDPARVAWAQARAGLEYGGATLYGERHRAIYAAIEAVCEGDLERGIAGAAVDLVLLHDELVRRGDLERAGGVLYLTQIAHEGLPGSVPAYCRGLSNYAIRRAALSTLSELSAQAQAQAQDIEGYLAHAVAQISALRPQTARGAQGAAELARAWYERAEARWGGGVAPGVVPTPWAELNALLGGGLPVGITVVAGATGMGKSVLGLRLALAAALSGAAVEVYTTEMGAGSVFDRAVAQTARVPRAALDSGRLSEAQQEAVTAALGRLVAAPLWIEDDPRLTASKICARALHRKATGRLDMLVVDYFQRVPIDETPRSARRSLAENLTQAAQAYQQLARDLQIPILLVSQVTDEVVKERRAPRPSDTKDCRALGHEAAAFIGVHRPAWYGLDAPRGRRGAQEEAAPDPSLIEVHVQGKRDTRQGIVRLRWEGDRHGIDAREDRYDAHNIRRAQ
jgi:replicative DNA helicase